MERFRTPRCAFQCAIIFFWIYEGHVIWRSCFRIGGGSSGGSLVHLHPASLFLVPGVSAAPWTGAQEIVEQEIPRLHHPGWGRKRRREPGSHSGGGRRSTEGGSSKRPPASRQPLPVWPHGERERGVVPALPVCLPGSGQPKRRGESR